jgi:hypothetical protein
VNTKVSVPQGRWSDPFTEESVAEWGSPVRELLGAGMRSVNDGGSWPVLPRGYVSRIVDLCWDQLRAVEKQECHFFQEKLCRWWLPASQGHDPVRTAPESEAT